MATGHENEVHTDIEPPSNIQAHGPRGQALHRIAAVRREQRLSLRTVARRIGTDIPTARRQEEETSDLRLSELYKWQAALDVPLADLLTDPGTPLSRPVMERAHMVRVMKTVMAIFERSESIATRRMAQMLIEQMIEIMPELEEVTAWHTVGQRRSLDEFGRIAEYPIPDAFLGDASQQLDY